MKNKYIAYEIEKVKLQQSNLSYEEYEERLRELARRLKI
jgi:hypothetical protein